MNESILVIDKSLAGEVTEVAADRVAHRQAHHPRLQLLQ